MHVKLKPSTRVAVTIARPKLFLFLVFRILAQQSQQTVSFVDLLDFLQTSNGQVNYFCRTKLPFYFWLKRLQQSPQGREILEYFDIIYDKTMLCLEKQQKTNQEEVSMTITKDDKTKLQEVFKKLESLADIKKQPTVYQKLCIESKQRNRFLIGIQDVLSLNTEFSRNQTLRIDRINEFGKTGHVPKEWIVLLSTKLKGVKLLERYSQKTSQDKSQPPKEKKKIIANNESITHPIFYLSSRVKQRGKVIPQKINASVLDRVLQAAKMKTDAELARYMGVNYQRIKSWRNGVVYISEQEIAWWMDKLSLSVSYLLDDLPENKREKGSLVEQNSPPKSKSSHDSDILSSDKKGINKDDIPLKDAPSVPYFIEQIIQKELLVAGSLDRDSRKAFFLGRLLLALPLYSIRAKDQKIILKKQEITFYYDMDHLDWDF